MADRSLTDPDFAPVFRGYDRFQVDAYVKEVRARLGTLEAEVNRAADALSETAIHPPPEYDRIGKEVGELLGEADRIATGMRERAAAEVEEWRAAAAAEVKALTDAAAADAEALRGDAWATSSALLEESQRKAEEQLANAEVASRNIRAEAEREAHRLVAGARRESDEQIRVAKMEAERVVAEALAERDEIVERARKTADAAQERARALEVRRDELLGELESVRATVQRLETDIEEKRQQLVPDSEPEATEETPEWGDGIRIIPAPEVVRLVEEFGEPVDALAVAEEVKRLREPKPEAEPEPAVALEPEPGPEAEPKSVAGPDTAPTTSTEPEPSPEADPQHELASVPPASTEPAAPEPDAGSADELSALFSTLRGETPQPEPEPEPEPEPDPKPKPAQKAAPSAPPAVDTAEASEEMLEARQRALLPITNGALRGIKRDLADAQNHALEAIRLESDWRPSQTDLSKLFEPRLREVREAAYEAGWVSAGGAEKVSGTPSKNRSSFAGDLAATLVRAAGKDSDTAARSTEVSRAFRSWRSDSAERHLRGEATIAFNEGAIAAIRAGGTEPRLAVRARGCVSCRADAEHALDLIPPLHTDCTCMVVAS